MDTQEHVHAFAETVVPATCQSSGYTLHRCDCGYEYKDQFIAATTHQFETVETTEATCTDGGVQQLRCATCGTTETRQIPAKGHLWGAWNVQTMPTCTESGRQSRSCTQCGAAETQEIKPTGHKLVNPKKSETKKGATEWFCENCGQTIVKKSAAKRAKKPLIILSILAVLIALPIILLSTVFKAEYHTFMAKTYMSLGMYEKAYYQLKELQSYCVRNCKDNCKEHEETLAQLDKFYVVVGKHTYKNALGNESVDKQEYDEDEHKIISQYGSGIRREEYFDENGNLILYLLTGGNFGMDDYPDDYRIQNTYDQDGNLTSSTQYDLDGKQIYKYEYTYDPDGNRTSVVKYDSYRRLENKYEYTYDPDGNQTSEVKYDANGKQEYKYEYTYDPDGNQTSEVKYDANGKQEYKYEYTYNKDGNIKTEKKYDATGKLQYTTENTYNKKGKLTSSKKYDDSGKLVSQKKVTYDKKGNKTVKQYGSNDQLRYKYEYKNGNMTSYTEYYKGEARDNYKYTYDKYGNETSRVRYKADGNREVIFEQEDFEVIYLVQD